MEDDLSLLKKAKKGKHLHQHECLIERHHVMDYQATMLEMIHPLVNTIHQCFGLPNLALCGCYPSSVMACCCTWKGILSYKFSVDA